MKPWYMSRKIWVAVVDSVVSISLAVVAYLRPDDPAFRDLMTVVIVGLQGPAMALIGAIAWEDNNYRNNAPYRDFDIQENEPEKPEVL